MAGFTSFAHKVACYYCCKTWSYDKEKRMIDFSVSDPIQNEVGKITSVWQKSGVIARLMQNVRLLKMRVVLAIVAYRRLKVLI
jgi:hypothetical protein